MVELRNLGIALGAITAAGIGAAALWFFTRLEVSRPLTPEEAQTIVEETTIQPTPTGRTCCEQCQDLFDEGKLTRTGLIACQQRCCPPGEVGIPGCPC